MDEQIVVEALMGNWMGGSILGGMCLLILSQFKEEARKLFRRNGKAPTLSNSTIRADAQQELLIEQIHGIAIETKEATAANGAAINGMANTLEKIEVNTATMAKYAREGNNGR